MSKISKHKFNHLKIHTQYSICEGAIKIDSLKNFCKERKVQSVGLSDTSNLCGALEFAESISKVGTQPIIGTQINFKLEDTIGLISLIALNDKGYKKIIELSSKSYLENNTHLDPHVDITELYKNTEGLLGANVGDLANHWVGRLARLHAHQTTTEAEAWRLVEWLVTSVDWLYIIGGNHDLWVGDGDPVQWMVRNQSGVYQAHGARINLVFPNKKEVRVNARHDWSGHSQWNSVHGPAKAAQMGIDDHIVISGHRHISGYQIIKQQNTGLISHALRVASYKIFDNYGKQLGLRNQNVSPAVVTVINPERELSLIHI